VDDDLNDLFDMPDDWDTWTDGVDPQPRVGLYAEGTSQVSETPAVETEPQDTVPGVPGDGFSQVETHSTDLADSEADDESADDTVEVDVDVESDDWDIEDLFGDGDATTEAAAPEEAPALPQRPNVQVLVPQHAAFPQAVIPASVAPVLIWHGGDDQYADDHIKEAAARIAARAGGYQEVTTLIRTFRLTRDAALDAEQRYDFELAVRPLMPKMGLTLSVQDLPRTLDLVYDEILGLGPLGAAWRAKEVTEIMVDGWDSVVVEVGGVLHRTDLRFRSPEHAAQVARSLAEMVSDRQLSPNNPLVTAKLDGARVNFAYGPVVPDIGLSISIRKFDSQMTMEGLLAVGALNTEMAELLGALVQAKATVLVSGATGAGKTTMIAGVAESIPEDERIITIEDARELDLGDRLSWVPMQTKERASADDNALVGQDALLENCLRMRPDRIIVGEIRDGKAAAVMLSAANTGHEGTMTTIHANSVSEALNSRLVRLVRRVEDSPIDVVREEVAEAFHLAVQITRRRGKRFVSEIAEVSPEYIDGQKIMPRTLWRGKLDATGSPVFTRVAGIDPDGRLAERLADIGINPDVFAAGNS
jgi:pilus assembly protein CpaF